MATSTVHRVVIAGGGVAGLEALIALRRLAGERAAVTLLAPDEEFAIRALSVHEPFARPAGRRYRLQDICAAHGAAHHRDTLQAVDAASGSVTTGAGAQLAYDSLLVAVGARAVPALEGAITFRGSHDADAVHDVVDEVERGVATSIAFVVPIGVTWPLPLYELALLTAERAASLGLEVSLTIVTPEDEPLAIFGTRGIEAVGHALQQARVAVIRSARVGAVHDGRVVDDRGRPLTTAQRVIAAPTLAPRPVAGLPCDSDGFLMTDEDGRVGGLPGVFGAGDGTSSPIKQGAIAAQQADAAARAIAERAGAAVVPQPLRPMARANLLTGTSSIHLRKAVSGGVWDTSSVASEHSLWWPPSKVAAPYLAPYLERLDRDTERIPTGHTTLPEAP